MFCCWCCIVKGSSWSLALACASLLILKTPLAWAVTFAGVSIVLPSGGSALSCEYVQNCVLSRTTSADQLASDLCWLLLMLGGGYFVILGGARSLMVGRLTTLWPVEHLCGAPCTLARERWVWLVSLSVVGSIYFFLLLRPNVTAAYLSLRVVLSVRVPDVQMTTGTNLNVWLKRFAVKACVSIVLGMLLLSFGEFVAYVWADKQT
jgi:hypothetical protein